MKLNWKSHWFIIINAISFCIALCDGFSVMKYEDVFPVFSLMGMLISNIIFIIYKIYVIFKVKKSHEDKSFDIIVLCICLVFPVIGFIGAITGALIGLKIAKIISIII